MEDGGLFVLVVPPDPIRCPPAPYERASLVASYFRRSKPKSKILILDAKGEKYEYPPPRLGARKPARRPDQQAVS
jgi:hypothetical protein